MKKWHTVAVLVFYIIIFIIVIQKNVGTALAVLLCTVLIYFICMFSFIMLQKVLDYQLNHLVLEKKSYS